MPPQRPIIDHVVIVVLENEEFLDSTFKSEAPFLWSLANPEGTGRYAFLAEYYAVTHPSLPNYLALTSGTTFGIAADCQPSECSQNSTSIANLLDEKHLSWREYAESMPSPCGLEIAGQYYPKHNPFAYYDLVTSDADYCRSHIVPLGDVSSKTGPFYEDLKNDHFPNYSFITPNICDDVHDCPLSTGDNWMKIFLSSILENKRIFESTVIFAVFDEGTSNLGFGKEIAGGHIYGCVIGPDNLVRRGAISETKYSHYSTLATIESIFDLGTLDREDVTATVIGHDVFEY